MSTGSGDVEIGTTERPGRRQDRLRRPRDRPRRRRRLDVSTGSGDLKIGAATRGKVTAKGASGDVMIGIPAGVPVWTDVTTVSGSIHSDLQGAGQPEPGADYVELRAKTVSGDIQLSEV